MAEYLREHNGTHLTSWETPPPVAGLQFRVLEEEWNFEQEPPLRIVRRVDVRLSIDASVPVGHRGPEARSG